MPLTHALYHAARAIAFAPKGVTDKAHKEQTLFRDRAQEVPKETAVSNTAESVIALTNHMIESELLRRGTRSNTRPLQKIWAKADVKITTSCLRRPATAAKCKFNISQPRTR